MTGAALAAFERPAGRGCGGPLRSRGVTAPLSLAQPCLFRWRAVAWRFEPVRLTPHLSQDAVLFRSTFCKRSDDGAAASNEAIVATAAASLHWLPVASMPPPTPPEQSWAWADREKNVAAIRGSRIFAFMSIASFNVAREPSPARARNRACTVPTMLRASEAVEAKNPYREREKW
jgi:hypothetical protein